MTVTSPDVFTCRVCGFDFEYERQGKSVKRFCEDCRRIRARERHRRWSAERTSRANDSERTVLLPDGHPVLPVLARAVDVLAAARLAQAAIHTGRYREAAEVLAAVV